MGATRTTGKWIDGLGGDQPLADAARLVLETRLGAVSDLLRAAGDGPDEPAVHQLRVSTRRAGASIDAFAGILDADAAKRVRRRLRRIRRTAGAARTADVHATRLEAMRGDFRKPVRRLIDDLVTALGRDRVKAGRRIVKEAAPKRVAKLEKRVRGLIESLDTDRLVGAPGANGHPARATLTDAARPALGAAIADVRAAAAEDLDDIERVHDLRKRGKALRYALEIFAPCLEPGFRAIYEQATELQEHLGDINDDDELRRIVEGHLPGPPGEAAGTLIAAIDEQQTRHLAQVHLDWADPAGPPWLDELARRLEAAGTEVRP